MSFKLLAIKMQCREHLFIQKKISEFIGAVYPDYLEKAYQDIIDNNDESKIADLTINLEKAVAWFKSQPVKRLDENGSQLGADNNAQVEGKSKE